jgi:homospermidine synthase
MKNNQLYFEKNILMFGCGALAQCALPILIKELNIKPTQITVLDFVDNSARVKQLIDQGMNYKQLKID